MSFDLESITTNALVVVPIVIALCEAIKLTGWVKNQFMPLVSIGVGVIFALIGNNDPFDFSLVIFSGAVYGLMASGLYSGVKTTMVARARMKSEKAKQKHV